MLENNEMYLRETVPLGQSRLNWVLVRHSDGFWGWQC